MELNEVKDVESGVLPVIEDVDNLSEEVLAQLSDNHDEGGND